MDQPSREQYGEVIFGHSGEYLTYLYGPIKKQLAKDNLLTNCGIGQNDDANQTLVLESSDVKDYIWTTYANLQEDKQVSAGYRHSFYRRRTLEAYHEIDQLIYFDFMDSKTCSSYLAAPDAFEAKSIVFNDLRTTEINAKVDCSNELLEKVICYCLKKITLNMKDFLRIVVPEDIENYQEYCRSVIALILDTIPSGLRNGFTFATNPTSEDAKKYGISFIKESMAFEYQNAISLFKQENNDFLDDINLQPDIKKLVHECVNSPGYSSSCYDKMEKDFTLSALPAMQDYENYYELYLLDKEEPSPESFKTMNGLLRKVKDKWQRKELDDIITRRIPRETRLVEVIKGDAKFNDADSVNGVKDSIAPYKELIETLSQKEKFFEKDFASSLKDKLSEIVKDDDIEKYFQKYNNLKTVSLEEVLPNNIVKQILEEFSKQALEKLLTYIEQNPDKEEKVNNWFKEIKEPTMKLEEWYYGYQCRILRESFCKTGDIEILKKIVDIYSNHSCEDAKAAVEGLLTELNKYFKPSKGANDDSSSQISCEISPDEELQRQIGRLKLNNKEVLLNNIIARKNEIDEGEKILKNMKDSTAYEKYLYYLYELEKCKENNKNSRSDLDKLQDKRNKLYENTNVKEQSFQAYFEAANFLLDKSADIFQDESEKGNNKESISEKIKDSFYNECKEFVVKNHMGIYIARGGSLTALYNTFKNYYLWANKLDKCVNLYAKDEAFNNIAPQRVCCSDKKGYSYITISTEKKNVLNFLQDNIISKSGLPPELKVEYTPNDDLDDFKRILENQGYFKNKTDLSNDRNLLQKLRIGDRREIIILAGLVILIIGIVISLFCFFRKNNKKDNLTGTTTVSMTESKTSSTTMSSTISSDVAGKPISGITESSSINSEKSSSDSNSTETQSAISTSDTESNTSSGDMASGTEGVSESASPDTASFNQGGESVIVGVETNNSETNGNATNRENAD